MVMAYRVLGLDPAPFAPLFDLDDGALKAIGARRMTADTQPGFPCRVSLADAAPGEDVILVNHAHLADDSTPYRARGPIFVREHAGEAAILDDSLPPYLTSRLLSLRAYDCDGMMVDADVIEGREAEPLIRRMLARGEIAHIDAHFARRGCYAARIERA